ncbi:hypothetical protein [Azospirillum tabaci]|uniref:hypothetical protein n=1 Tax=Azospirillum tabaci TaxID=2752310 RepID=UPI00166037D2|nr:hypothetical protein [Azospirillum tabaci]
MVEKILYATPYGLMVDVYRVDTPAGPVLRAGLEETAKLYGIHDRLIRRRFVAEATGKTEAEVGELILKHGGHETQAVALPAPGSVVFPAYERSLSKPAREALGLWIALVSAAPSWPERAVGLLKVFDAIMKAGVKAGGRKDEVTVGADIARTLTCILEHLGEQKVDRLDAAAFYALAEHAEWAGAGRQWLAPIRGTWLRDWVAARPVYRQAAQLVSRHRHAPSWLWHHHQQWAAPSRRQSRGRRGRS